uniref:Uncharacterized protein n=1 Tax=Arion vulgaris TaxID=1028688 RepID=A0A0B7AVG2_9EUPU
MFLIPTCFCYEGVKDYFLPLFFSENLVLFLLFNTPLKLRPPFGCEIKSLDQKPGLLCVCVYCV